MDHQGRHLDVSQPVIVGPGVKAGSELGGIGMGRLRFYVQVQVECPQLGMTGHEIWVVEDLDESVDLLFHGLAWVPELGQDGGGAGV